MKKTFTVAKYTFTEATRDKFVWFVFFLMLSGIPLGLFLQALALYGADSVYKTTVIAMMSAAMLSVSALYVNISVRREAESSMMAVILARPVPNYVYLAGKYLGYMFISLIYVIIMVILLLLLRVGTFSAVLQFALGLWLLQGIVTAWSLFFALLLNSLTMSIIASAVSWVIFSSVRNVFLAAGKLQEPVSYAAGRVLYLIIPDYSRFDFKHELLYGIDVSMKDLAILPVYAAVYVCLVMILAWLDFSRKEF